jgi:hypothetical protein
MEASTILFAELDNFSALVAKTPEVNVLGCVHKFASPFVIFYIYIRIEKNGPIYLQRLG